MDLAVSAIQVEQETCPMGFVRTRLGLVPTDSSRSSNSGRRSAGWGCKSWRSFDDRTVVCLLRGRLVPRFPERVATKGFGTRRYLHKGTVRCRIGNARL